MHIILKELLAKWECEVVEFGGEADHVHLLFETHPGVELAKLEYVSSQAKPLE